MICQAERATPGDTPYKLDAPGPHRGFASRTELGGRRLLAELHRSRRRRLRRDRRRPPLPALDRAMRALAAPPTIRACRSPPRPAWLWRRGHPVGRAAATGDWLRCRSHLGGRQPGDQAPRSPASSRPGGASVPVAAPRPRCPRPARSRPGAPPPHWPSQPAPAGSMPSAGGHLYALAGLCTYSPVHTGVHFPGDVVAGAADRRGRGGA